MYEVPDPVILPNHDVQFDVTPTPKVTLFSADDKCVGLRETPCGLLGMRSKHSVILKNLTQMAADETALKAFSKKRSPFEVTCGHPSQSAAICVKLFKTTERSETDSLS